VSLSAGLAVVATDVPSLDWSPDGTSIAFAALEDSVSAIYVAGMNGGHPVRVSGELGQADLPTWSPDGSWIAYRSVQPDGFRRHLKQVRPDGTEDQDLAVVIAEDGYLSRLRWSPIDDRLSYFQNVGFGAETTAVIDLRFGHVAQVWQDGVGRYPDNGMPWSPDGSRVAMLTATEGVVVAGASETDGDYDGHILRLGSVAECWINWSPDGTALYGGAPDGCHGVVVIPLQEPGAAESIPGSTTGTASWQPLP
jgi:Tol biopolymer transport system component